jgi:hypothetical protein
MNALVNGVPDDGHEDRPGEEHEDEAEEKGPEPHVLTGELRLHQKRMGSSAIAMKRSAR